MRFGVLFVPWLLLASGLLFVYDLLLDWLLVVSVVNFLRIPLLVVFLKFTWYVGVEDLLLSFSLLFNFINLFYVTLHCLLVYEICFLETLICVCNTLSISFPLSHCFLNDLIDLILKLRAWVLAVGIMFYGMFFFISDWLKRIVQLISI